MPSPERILLFGLFDSGKTYQILKTAQWLKESGAQFYVADTDDSYPRNLTEFPGLDAQDGGNVHVTFCSDWQGLAAWHDETQKTVRPMKDFSVVDRADKAWAWVQNWFNEEVYGKSLAERMLEARKRSSKKSAMLVSAHDMADWQTINAAYSEWFTGVMYRNRSHVFMTAALERVRGEDSDELKAIYSPFGVNPAGQKNIGYEPHTVLLLSKAKDGHWYVRTVKDRGIRRRFDPVSGELLVSLPHQYLLAIASWSEKGMPGS